jgi:TPP-dependent indolepyruvate ferredoxin oxidoreductase alpha subunit
MTTSLASSIAQALVRAGVTLATHVPGHGATQTFAAFCEATGAELPISFHEEPAYAIAHGAALTGRRSACIIKSHGLTKALNAALDSLSAGVTAAMINIVFEDRSGAHSDNVFEIEPILAGSEMPYVRSTARSAYEDALNAIERSEELRLPFTLLFDSAEIDEDAPQDSKSPPPSQEPPAYSRDIFQHLVCPIFAPYQREVLVQKLKEADWRGVPRPALPMLPDSLPPDYQRAVAPYLPIFESFKQLEFDFVCGDAGVSTLSAFPPYEIASAALYMGGSIPTAIGAHYAGKKKSWAFTGDFSFIAAGHYGLIECALRKTPINVLIFANGRAQTTGGQPLDLAILERLIDGYSRYVRRIPNPNDRLHALSVLGEANDSDELRIIVADFV